MAFQLSPGVVTSEVDLTTVVPAVGTTTGAFAGTFNWGPAELPIQVTNETKLVEYFGKPDNNTAVSFFTCSNFLAYASDIRVVRAVNGVNTNTAVSNSSSNVLIKNDLDYFNNYYSTTSGTVGAWAARYPGAKGNSLRVSTWANTNATIFASWAYGSLNLASYFAGAPGTSAYANSANSSNDEMHIAVIDEDGLFTGTANTVLETFAYVSKASNAKDSVGNSNYYRDVIYSKSKYIHWCNHLDSSNTAATWGTALSVGKSYAQLVNVAAVHSVSLVNGTDGSPVSGNVQTAYAKFVNPEEIDISLIMTGDADKATDLYVVNSITDVRKDCIAFISPTLANSQSGVASVVAERNDTNINSSYAVMDNGWKYQYDKYNDVYRWVPLNGDVAGLCAYTDQVRDPWFSPAGSSRGQVKNAIKLTYVPVASERDTLYKNGINPVVAFPGEGTMLYGDKTMLAKPSAFDRINVRRLFIVLEKAIAIAARAQLFEFNDEFARAQFKSIVEPFLRTIKGRRGIYDFRVVCDTTNNTPAVIDGNQFVGDIYIKPARSTNFIQLNFIAVRTGVAFDEVVGKF